jgi:hypothetical protein
MDNQTESNNAHTELLNKLTEIDGRLTGNAASAYAYNKINNILLMQVLAHLENRDLEEIRSNVDNYIARFTEEYMKKNA